MTPYDRLSLLNTSYCGPHSCSTSRQQVNATQRNLALRWVDVDLLSQHNPYCHCVASIINVNQRNALLTVALLGTLDRGGGDS